MSASRTSCDAMQWHSGELQKIDIDGVLLECVCYGPPPSQAVTIVLMHEGLGCASLWRGFPERLSELTGCGVFAYSRQGYGGSDPCELPRPVDYMEREAEAVVPALLNRIGLRKGILLGHSDGGTIAGLYLGTHQDHRVRGLIMMAPHFFTEESNLDTIANITEAYESDGLRERLQRYHGDNVDCAFYGWSHAWLNPAFRDWDVREAIGYIRIPVLYIQGDVDPYGSKDQAQAVIDECTAPVEVHFLADCEHAPHLEYPDQTLALIQDFVGRLLQAEAGGTRAA